MEAIKKTEEDIINMLIETGCKNVLGVMKVIKNHIQEEKDFLYKKNANLMVKYANLERMYNKVLDIQKENRLDKFNKL